MWYFMRAKRDEFTKSFANDFITATGKLPVQAEFIKYRLLPSFDQWIQQIFMEWQTCGAPYEFKSLPIIYGVTETTADFLLPSLTMIAPSRDVYGRDYPFAAMRILAHPLAREFNAIIPCFYRDTVTAFSQLVSQSFEKASLSDVLLQIENLKIFNSRLMRKTVLESIVYPLRSMKADVFWQSLPGKLSPTGVTTCIKKYIAGNYKGIRLPLPKENKWLFSGIVFWMQLLESVLKEKFHHWQLYWHENTPHHSATLIFYNGDMPADEFIGLWHPECLSEDIIDVLKIPAETVSAITIDATVSLIQFLSSWSDHINHARSY